MESAILTWFLFLGLLIAVTAPARCTTSGSAIASTRPRPQLPDSSFTRGENCKRRCGRRSKNCYFEFVVERYAVMGGACGNCSEGVQGDCMKSQCITADGRNRPSISNNRVMPGPAIEVCLGDKVIVDVVNLMPDEATTIHWHGILQKGTQYFDGVPFVTQCPILPMTTFRYTFVPDAAGTFFYHSHIGVQKSDGHSGAFIVRESIEKETLSNLYDEDLSEHIVYIQDWTDIPTENFLPGYSVENIPRIPDSFLINGRGLHYEDPRNIKLPLAEFIVKKGKRYRFRLIGGIFLSCAVSVTFAGHRVLVITADGGHKFRPLPVDSVVLNSAERFDVVLNANQTEDVYYIHVQSINSNCGVGRVRQVGLLRYETMERRDVLERLPPLNLQELGRMFNAVNSTCDGSNRNEICFSMVEGNTNAPRINNLTYHQIPIRLTVYEYRDKDLFRNGTYQRYEEVAPGQRLKLLINDISFSYPSSVLISQYNDVPKDSFCKEECRILDKYIPCTCTNVDHVRYGSIVDLVIVDEGRRSGFDHPFHLHGFNFYVLEMGIFQRDPPMELELLKIKLREDKVNLRARPLKDTISIPASGYAVIRFLADNPGFWIYHCHFTFHLESGMAGIIHVGEKRHLPPVPKNFPKCGNFWN